MTLKQGFTKADLVGQSKAEAIESVSNYGEQEIYNNDGSTQLVDGLSRETKDIDGQTIMETVSDDNEGQTENAIQIGAANNTITDLIGIVKTFSRSLTPNVITFTANDENADFSATDAYVQMLFGDFANCSRDLPDATGLSVGWSLTVVNASKDFKHIYNSDKTKVIHIPPYCSADFRCVNTSSAAGIWRWSVSILDTRNGFELKNEWYVDSISSDDGPLPLYTNTNGTGSRFFNNGYNNGFARLESGTDIDSYTVLYNSNAYNYFNNGAMACYAGISFSALSDGTDNYRGFLGFNTTIDGTDGTDMIGLKTDYAAFSNDNAWRAVTRDSSGTINNIDTAIDPALYGATSLINSGQNLRVEINSDGTRADFWINNANVANTITAVPTSNWAWLNMVMLKTAGTNERTLGCDHVGLIRTYSTERW